MQELIVHLSKRRIFMVAAVFFLAVIAVVVSYNFKITPSNYFNGRYNNYFIYTLIIYKIVELSILYYILLYRHLVYLRKNSNYVERLPKLRKHTRLLLFLIPQGNTVFGIIAYKLSGNVSYFLIFSCIALITLLLVKPKSLNVAKEQ